MSCKLAQNVLECCLRWTKIQMFPGGMPRPPSMSCLQHWVTFKNFRYLQFCSQNLPRAGRKILSYHCQFFSYAPVLWVQISFYIKIYSIVMNICSHIIKPCIYLTFLIILLHFSLTSICTSEKNWCIDRITRSSWNNVISAKSIN